jgi:polyribonucleotide nucleotidyltransferase
MPNTFTFEIGGRDVTIETGKMARQASGSVTVRMADTVVLATAVAADKPREGVSFLPLVVNYQEKAYAAGKIPGGFFKREGRPGERETLTSRLIDRPIRPLFPEGWRFETQVIVQTLSADQENEPDILGIIGASCALHLSNVPFQGPIGGVRIGRVAGQFIVNPTITQMKEGDLNIVVAGTRDSILMVEAGAKVVSEEVILEALRLAQIEIRKIVDMIETIRRECGKPKTVFVPDVLDEALVSRVAADFGARLAEAIVIQGKGTRKEALTALQVEAAARYAEDEVLVKKLGSIFELLEEREARRLILDERKRVDGRGLTDIRPITCDVGLLPRTHGSGLFTRGETQALVISTLGTGDDEQMIDDLGTETRKRFMLHYNFPPFSVGETGMLRSPGRREIGHGALAERAVSAALPAIENFPYTIRIVSDILESNGSSSMATVCGATLSLMDAGVPITAPIAGIAMGLVKEGEKFGVLSDILGLEDHYGDMDFKVAGSAEGITALQMDIKIGGITVEIMEIALRQAKEGRLYILGKMIETLARPRETISVYAPRILTIKIKVDKIRDVIGPGGKVIRSIIEQTGVKIDVQDDGTINIASADEEAARKAMAIIEEIVQEVEVGRIYQGKVKKIMDFGAFVEIIPGTEGLVHISQLAEHRVEKVTDVVTEGDEFPVKVLSIDRDGKIKLSRKEALREQGEQA